MATRRMDERTSEERGHDRESRRWHEEEERWPPSQQVGEHDRPWQHPEETWPSRRGMYGMGGASRAYNQGGYGGRGAYERGYAMHTYDTLADVSRHWFGPDLEGYADERDLRAAWELPPPRHREERPRGKAPKGYQRSDDRIREDVCERLMASPLDASDVEVKVENAEVTLAGTVRSRNEKRAIEDLAASVLGVHDVHNRIRIGPERPARPLHS